MKLWCDKAKKSILHYIFDFILEFCHRTDSLCFFPDPGVLVDFFVSRFVQNTLIRIKYLNRCSTILIEK